MYAATHSQGFLKFPAVRFPRTIRKMGDTDNSCRPARQSRSAPILPKKTWLFAFISFICFEVHGKQGQRWPVKPLNELLADHQKAGALAGFEVAFGCPHKSKCEWVGNFKDENEMEQTVTQLTTDQVLEIVRKKSRTIIDIRPVEAYNGWKSGNEERGGHIPGARSMPLKWFQYIDWPEIIAAKDITADQHICIYGYDAAECAEAAGRFSKAGFKNVDVYEKFVEEWSANASLPIERLERYRHLVSAQWLQSLLKTGSAPEHTNEKFVVCHAHYRNPDAYNEGHIPGAIEIDTNTLESPKTWNRRTPEELKQTLEQNGITCDTTVILYGRFSFPDNNDSFPGSSAGHLGAIRCAAIMLYAGVKDVRVLNGGLQSWMDAGYDISTERTEKQPVQDFGAAIPQRSELFVDTPEAKEIIAAGDKNLVSVRSWPEWIGEVSGYNYIEKKGRIPGAVFGNCGSDAYHMENYRNVDHTIREHGEVEKIWEKIGVTADKHNAFYCGTGWRGSEAFFNAWLLGWPRVSVYDGGWFEWSSDSANPYETGTPR